MPRGSCSTMRTRCSRALQDSARVGRLPPVTITKSKRGELRSAAIAAMQASNCAAGGSFTARIMVSRGESGGFMDDAYASASQGCDTDPCQQQNCRKHQRDVAHSLVIILKKTV